MRVELNKNVKNKTHVLSATALSVEWGVDAVYVPPFLVGYAADQLGRVDVNIVTTVARPEDLLDTKIAGLDAAKKAGADEVIVCVDPSLFKDEDWKEIEKEVEQLGIVANMHGLFLWLGCRFHYLSRVNQVRTAELVAGLKGTGIRARDCDLKDVSVAKICGVDFFCLGLQDDDPSIESMNSFRRFGATQAVFKNKPPQERVEDVEFNLA